MRVTVIGGDGFCGWPTALHLSANGHSVQIIDNGSRRKLASKLNAPSLTPLHSLSKRLKVWHELSGIEIDYENVDVARNSKKLVDAVRKFEPDTIVHLAAQRSAPYSMFGEEELKYTVFNNITSLLNTLQVIATTNRNIHLIHLGSIGMYGYRTRQYALPEGLSAFVFRDSMNVEHAIESLHPSEPGTIYHLTKYQASIMMDFYSRTYCMPITDLLQGVVWGTQTKETLADARLLNRFDYDSIYGTVINRFLLQGTSNRPLTVYGSGGQMRALIHLSDSVRCVELAARNPPKTKGRVRTLHQITEKYSIMEIAEKAALWTNGEVMKVPNPRVENEEHFFDVNATALVELGLQPIRLDAGLASEVGDIVSKFSHRIRPHVLDPTFSIGVSTR